MSQDEQEPKATDLLPPEEPEVVEPARPIAARRVAGWSTTDRLLSRTIRRPAGNSRGFWSRIEDDDPFARRRPRRPEHIADQEIYASDRLVRVEDGRAVPARGPSNPPPQPKRPAPPAPKPEQPAARQAAPTPAPATGESAAAPPIDRRPPRIAHTPSGARSTGRVPVRRGGPDGDKTQRRTAAEIRAEKEAARKAIEPEAPPQLRNLDNILGVFGDLAAAQNVFEENEARAKAGKPPLEEPSYTPEPRPAPRPARSEEPARQPTPKPSPPPSEPDRSPTGSKNQGMDDLFGGGNEGRVKIGKRQKPKS